MTHTPMTWSWSRGPSLTPSGPRTGACGVGRNREALKRIRSDSGEGRTFTREELAEAWGISE